MQGTKAGEEESTKGLGSSLLNHTELNTVSSPAQTNSGYALIWGTEKESA